MELLIGVIYFLSIIAILSLLIFDLEKDELSKSLLLIILTTFFISFFISLYLYNKMGPSVVKVFRDKFKNQAIKTLIKSFNESLEYEPKNSIPQEIYEKAEFSTFETYWSEDLISGKVLNDCKVNMAEVHTGVSTNKEFITIFNGMFAVIDTPKTFNKAIHIRENNRNVKFSDLKIELDFTDFENLFDIYSSDEITTMQILTADNMQKLVEFYKKTSIPYEFTIKDNHIYIALPFGRLFEPSKRLLIISPKSFSKSDMKLFAIDREELYRNYLILNYTFELIEILVKIVNDTPYE